MATENITIGMNLTGGPDPLAVIIGAGFVVIAVLAGIAWWLMHESEEEKALKRALGSLGGR